MATLYCRGANGRAGCTIFSRRPTPGRARAKRRRAFALRRFHVGRAPLLEYARPPLRAGVLCGRFLGTADFQPSLAAGGTERGGAIPQIEIRRAVIWPEQRSRP